MFATTISLVIAAASLVVSVVALWRSGRARVLDLRTEVRREAAELRTRLPELRGAIDRALQSRQAVSAALGLGRSGAMEVFTREAGADKAEVDELIERLDDLDTTSGRLGYDAMEAKAVAARAMRTRCDEITDKYKAAHELDERGRQHVRDVVVAKVGRTPTGDR